MTNEGKIEVDEEWGQALEELIAVANHQKQGKELTIDDTDLIVLRAADIRELFQGIDEKVVVEYDDGSEKIIGDEDKGLSILEVVFLACVLTGISLSYAGLVTLIIGHLMKGLLSILVGLGLVIGPAKIMERLKKKGGRDE